MGDTSENKQIEEIHNAIFNWDKVEAIRLYCIYSKKGIKESQDYIEKLAKELDQSCPEKFTDKPNKLGCLTILMILFSVVFLI